MDNSDRLESRLTTIVSPEVLGRGIGHRMASGIYAHCLEEDLLSHILPAQRRHLFSVEAIPSTDAARAHIKKALSWESRHQHGNLEDFAWEFFRQSASSFVEDGEAVWEVCPHAGGGIALVHVQPSSLKHRRRWSLQVTGSGRTTLIPKERLVRVASKESMAFRRVHKLLGEPGLQRMPLASLTDCNANLSEAMAYERLALARVSSLCSWHGGTFFAGDVTELYYVVRIIRFFSAAARLRDAILEGINSALRGAGTGAQMALKGLQDGETLDGLERDLLAGKKSVKATIDLLFSTA